MERGERSPHWSKKREPRLPHDLAPEERLKWYAKWKRLTVHPDLRIDYFQEISTKEKAYWLGFLYADGCLGEIPGGLQVRFALARSDETVIDKFCESVGASKSKKEYRKQEETELVEIRFACKKMVIDLLKHGLMPQKTERIKYPELISRDLELAFLLGYYDGDGKQGSTMISGNIKFLDGIRRRYELPFKIVIDEHETKIYGREIRGISCYLSLGAGLFNEMMKNYTDSMPRKRRYFCDSKEKIRRSNLQCTAEKVRRRRELQKNWRSIGKDELARLVWEKPSTQIAVKYNVAAMAVTRKCRSLGIPKPGRGYWAARGSSGKRIKQ